MKKKQRERSYWWLLTLSAALCCCGLSHAQVVVTNPLEWAALIEGNGLINGEVEEQTSGQKETVVLSLSMSAMLTQMHSWEAKYNSYLKSASGYASSLNACTHLYQDGLGILICLWRLSQAIEDNPQGIVASLSMNNVAIEAATQLVSVYNLLGDAVSQGGKENMLDGAARSKVLWALNDELSTFRKKLHQLYLSIRFYTLADVWNSATAGMLDKDAGTCASEALERWKRAAVIVKSED